MGVVKEVRVGIGSHISDKCRAESRGTKQRQTTVTLGHSLGIFVIRNPPRILRMEGVVVVILREEPFLSPSETGTSCPVEDERVDVGISLHTTHHKAKSTVVRCLFLKRPSQTISHTKFQASSDTSSNMEHRVRWC